MPHISFSELKNWDNCPWYHKLVNIEKNKLFQGNEYTAFGTALHEVCEQKLLDPSLNEVEHFEHSFLNELKSLPVAIVEGLDKKRIEQMREAGRLLAVKVIPALDAYFSEGYEVLQTEEDLMVDIDNQDGYKFKGFIDLVVKDSSGTIHIIDWKTCSWGWDTRRRTEPMTTYQLTLYKNFYAKKHGVEPSQIETHFALLKRTAKKNHVEFFIVSSGPKKTENALNLLDKALYNIKNKNYVKNRLACHGMFGACEFYDTEHCTRN